LKNTPKHLTMKVLLKSLLLVTLLSQFIFSTCEKETVAEQPEEDIIKDSVTISDTVVLNPHHNPGEVHIFGNPYLDQTYPDAVEILGGAGTYDGVLTTIRAVLKFGQDTLPQDVEVQSAKLTLYSNPTPLNGNNGNANIGNDNSLLIQRVTSSWDTATIKWANQPATTTENEITVPHTNVPFEDIIDLDVTQLVKDIQSNINYGVLIRLKNEEPYNFRIFCSSKYEDETKHPKLEIIYTKKVPA
ncbi:MAG: DNRLRE domain-containing protein, partial [Chitinophagaceae bacterium]|nr:DNRLRE domain-containing protein [Chitinophagaceae bacterium]